MTIPNVPENHLTERIKKLISVCEELDETDYDEDDDAFIFNPGATIEDVKLWETKNNIKIPSSFKEWLMFSNGSVLCDSRVELYSLDNLIVENSKKPYNVPDEFVIIGAFVGIEEYGFSVDTGKFMIFREYDEMDINGFESILEWITTRIG